MPTFWLGIMLIFIFSGPGLNILPAGGMIDDPHCRRRSAATPTGRTSGSNPLDAILDIGKHLILPVVTLVA